MANKTGPVRMKKPLGVTPIQKPAISPKLAQMLKDYETATEQYGVIVRYLRVAIEVLPNPECELVLEFAESAKDHCERLHRQIEDHLGRHKIA